ncbi:MAG: PEGA domain-containing protein [Deltaproteobacteria bacterium]|nr:PEGA domain-containing protein [Deltaproteobacteria bacterium]
MPSSAAVLCGLLVCLSAPLAFGQDAVPPVATSTSAEAAKLHAEAGKAYFQAGDYTNALASFKKAYEMAKTGALAYNIGRCHEKLSQWKEAIGWFETYVTMVSDPREKAETLDKIEILKKKLGPDAGSPEAKYEARIQAGRAAYSKSDYEGAIEEFKAAFDLKATPSALYNIAKSYEKMGRYEEAIDNYQQYLDLDPKASDRADVEETIKRLKKSIKERFQELSVSSDPPGADVYLDDRNTGLQGQTNYRGKVTPGPHTLYIDLNGYEPVKRDFIMPDDKPLALDFKMKKLENVGSLDIVVNVEGARIFVDGAIIGLSPYKQKKVVEAGKHQVQVEASGYNRWTGEVNVARDQVAVVNVELLEFEAPVEDDTLTSWGRNLMLIGIIGGGLGFAGPFVYQKIAVRRPYYDQLGPETLDGNPFYKGPLAEDDANRRDNGELKTMQTIQLISLIAGGVITAGGLSFFIYKWVRTVPPKPVGYLGVGEERPLVELNGIGVVPTADGAAFGLSGSF